MYFYVKLEPKFDVKNVKHLKANDGITALFGSESREAKTYF